MEYHSTADSAIKSFEKKFKDKTKNEWKNRENFKPFAGKYTLIEMDAGEDTIESAVVESDGKKVNLKDCQPSKLDPETQDLINLIFDQDMFKGALKKYDIGF